MDFTLEELRSTLEEMGLRNIPDSHLQNFAKDLKHLMRHEKHVQKRKQTLDIAVDSARPTLTPTVSKFQTDVSPRQVAQRSHSSSEQVDFNLATHKKSYSEPALQIGKNQASKPTTPNAQSARSAPQVSGDKAKQEEKWRKMRSDPVRLYGWYKTHWDFHGLE